MAASFLAGAVGWTLAEYLLHRFLMHEMRGKGLASKEHLKHHADVTYFAPSSKKAMTAVGVTAVGLPAAWPVLGKQRALALVAGLDVTYYVYEIIHRRCHTHPPKGRYGRWLRKSHFHHHFGAPMRNFGVTTPVWDKVFHTEDDPGQIRVPRRMAMTWLLDDDGEVRADLAADYAIVGSRPLTEEQRDHDRVAAFANEIPEY